jgi:hypothetical protein
VLIVSVLQKSKQTGILEAIGARRRQILRIFIERLGIALAGSTTLADRILLIVDGRIRELAKPQHRARTAGRLLGVASDTPSEAEHAAEPDPVQPRPAMRGRVV